MNKKITSLLFVFIFITKVFSQTPNTIDASKHLDTLKAQGKLDPTINHIIVNPHPSVIDQSHAFDYSRSPIRDAPNSNHSPLPPAANYCSCIQPIDATWQICHFDGSGGSGGPGVAPQFRNDDWSTVAINLPFSFCLYGTNYNTVYINNNGNVSFGGAYSTFTSVGFPSNQYVMVAPFWADVDTRDLASGLVYYKITPTHLLVHWDHVGYYAQQSDLLNDFQLIITDGADPLIPPGNNVAFCYGDMQWTTGAASSGVGGFGGSPATVGINKGDGVNYVQMGQFNQAGAIYNGPYATDDGIDWLDGKSFYFNSCSATNLPPVVSGFNNCDTLRICGTGDTLVLNGLFLSPENGQTTTVSINLNGTPNATVLTNTTGNTASVSVMVVATMANAGNNIITFTATDDGVPVGVSVVSVNIFVDTSSATSLHPSITGNALFCPGDSVLLSVSPSTYTYSWNTGANTSSIYAHTNGQYWVTSSLGTCQITNFINVVSYPAYPLLVGPTITDCGTGTTTLSVTPTNFVSYLWSNGNTTTIDTVGPGNYSVTITDSHGCIATSPTVNVITVPPPIISALADTTIECGESANLRTTFTGPGIPSVCGLTSSGGCAGGTTPITIGTGALNTTFPTPYVGVYENGRIQILYRATDLNALGFTGGKISELAFNVAQKNSSQPYNSFTIKMGCTNQNDFSSNLFVPALTVVYGPTSYSTVLGWNNYILSSAYEWDGVSNLIVEICFNNSSWTSSDAVTYTGTAYNSVLFEFHDTGFGPGCGFSAPTAYTQRPHIRFKTCSSVQNPANYVYQWTSNSLNGNIANPTLQNTTAQPFTNTTYSVSVVNVNGGCTTVDSIHVILTPINSILIVPPPQYCLFSNIDTLQALTNPNLHPVPNGSCVWHGAGITDSVLGVFSPLQAGVGTHLIQCTMPISICGSADTSILITVLNQFDPTINPVAPVCSSYPSFSLTAANPGGSWSGPGITDTINGIFNPGLPGLVGYDTIAYTIYTPCYSRDTVVINVVQQLDATINPPANPFCTGSAPFNLTSVGAGGTWVGTGITNANTGEFSPAVSGPGTFVISHYLTAFCGDTATTTVRVEPAPIVSFTSPDTTGCEPITVQFNATCSQTGGIYYWNFGDANDSTSSTMYLNPSNTYTSYNSGVPYNVTFIYTDTIGCADTSVHNGMVIVYSQPHAHFSATPQPTDLANPEIHFMDHSVGVIDTWIWTFGTGAGSSVQNPSYVYPDSGHYQVQLIVMNNNGCVDTIEHTIIIDPITTTYIPNAFTPDENGTNEEFRVMGYGIREEDFEMLIFDRWGERVFGTNDLHLGWNGSKNNSGQKLKQDVYVYKINLKDYKGLEHQYIGQVTLVR